MDIQLPKQGDQIVRQVHDNGRGITQEQIANPTSFGILGMRERTLALGANLDLRSEPHMGTELIACIPMSAAPHSAEDLP